MENWTQITYWNNTVRDYLIALGIIVVGLIVLRLIKGIVLNRVKQWSVKSNTTVDDFLIRIVEKAVLPILCVSIIYAGIRSLSLPVKVVNVLHVAMVVVVIFFSIKLVTSMVEYLMLSYLGQKEKKEEDRRKEFRGMIIIFNVIIWGLGIIFLMDNLGFNVTTVLTGLGIGGIAIALAAQTILGDLFAYFAIFFDRPFEIGDFIIVGDKLGSIEHIGIKTTRIRSLWGEELIYSNKGLTDSWIQNYKRMERRRVVFGFNLPFQTPVDKLERVPVMVKKIVEEQQNVLLDRAHFASYTDFAYHFEVVYYVLTPDYNVYMDIQQSFNLEILRRLEQEGIPLAYPAQNIFLPGQQREGKES